MPNPLRQLEFGGFLSPTLSFVAAARNDDYGGKLVQRLSASLRVIAHLSAKTQIPVEYILVEYNPPPDTPSLLDELPSLANNFFRLRCITVPASFHERFGSRIPLLEYIAKNIGIRRAAAPYVVATNIDILFSEEIFAFLASGDLRDDLFYRADRYNLSLDSFPDQMNAAAILRLAARSIDSVMRPESLDYISYRLWLRRLWRRPKWSTFKLSPAFDRLRPHSAPGTIHEHAAGDFLLMHEKLWAAVGGYDETPLSSYYDGYILYVLTCYRYSQRVLPFRIFHIDHLVGKAGRPSASFEKYRADTAEMLRTKKPYRPPSPDWGFPGETFAEAEA